MSGAGDNKTLPGRVVVGATGAYWRDYGTHFSMCPTSDDNDPVNTTAIYELVWSSDGAHVDGRLRSGALLARIEGLEAEVKRLDGAVKSAAETANRADRTASGTASMLRPIG